MSKETKITDLQNIDPKNLPELQGFEEKQHEIVKNNPFIEIIDNETYQEAKKRRTALVSARTGLQNQDKVIATSLKTLRNKALIFANGLIKITLPHEERQQAEVKRYEAIKEAEKARKAEEERQRVLKIRQKIDEFEGEVNKMADNMVFSTIEEVKHGAEHFLAECKSDFDFQEFEELFVEAGSRAMASLFEKERVLRDKEAQRLENERLAKEAEEAKRFRELQSERMFLIKPHLGHGPDFEIDSLCEMPQEDFDSLISKKRKAHAEAKAEQEKKDAEEAERQAKLDADNKKIAEQQEEIRKKEAHEKKMSDRIKRLTQEIGLKWDFDTSFVGDDGINVSMVEVKTLTDEEYSAVVKKLLDFKNKTEEDYTPPSTFHDNEIDKIEEVDFEVSDSIKKEMEELIIDLRFRFNSNSQFEDEKAQLLWAEIDESFEAWITEQRTKIQNL